MSNVNIGKTSGPSGRALRRRLREANYRGPAINFGYTETEGLNRPSAVALASHKHKALLEIRESGIPTPPLYPDAEYPLVGRKNHHRGGSGFWLVNSSLEKNLAEAQGATHFMEFITDTREFRVHVVGKDSIKISEKIGGGVRRNFKHGARFQYPWDFDHKITLRKLAKEAVQCLGLDFGAVDILYREDDGTYFVLEVNTAPCLTDGKSDTLERYVQAFLNWETNHEAQDETVRFLEMLKLPDYLQTT